ncbi:HAMP domain-containing protein [Gluconacetobacter aggeris]|uniref:histidine kinase n=1 Tax=Gluconacetobacter aggeris TaxID=1286186 RepID=A0A7W4NX00_9PROT|nr:HAMP domain-containing sensor histidine kinase [Gluconacetobacter aggeris]MBB2169094.1 HAMP domain-containing protein [Gluconacetobacter aggeris]
MDGQAGGTPWKLSVLRSSSFRIVALFAACCFICGMTVTALSGYRSLHSLTRQIHEAVANERDEALSGVSSRDVAHLTSAIRSAIRSDPTVYYLLQDAHGRTVAGNMRDLPRIDGPRHLSWTWFPLPPDGHPVVGQGQVLDDGGYFFVGMDGASLRSMRRDVWLTLVWSGGGFLLIGLGGGFVLSRLVLRRIETISQTARDIMRGDISRRIVLNATNDEFEHLAGSLNAMLDRNEAQIASIRQVTNDIAHDMRRPLARLGEQLDMAAEATAPQDRVRAITRSMACLDEALEIFSTLLKLAQIEADDRAPDPQRLPIADLLASLAGLYGPVAEDHGQTLVLVPPEGGLELDGNRVLLTQVLANLIENAINHSPAGTRITVTARRAGGKVVLAVADTGPGIPAHERERVFGKMVRLDGSRATPGTGLGLSMVRAIVRLHGGEIRLLDNAPHGLRCEVTMPATTGRAPEWLVS